MSKAYLDDDDIDLSALGFQDDGDYIKDKKKGWTARASERDIHAIRCALQGVSLPGAMASDMRTLAATIANSTGLFTERTMWPLSSTSAFLGRIYKDDYERLADTTGGGEDLAKFFKESLADLFPVGQQLTPIEMLIGLTHFEAAFSFPMANAISHLPLPKDFMDIPFLTLKQYSRPLSSAEVARRIKSANDKIAKD